ncbi:CREB5 protein, partial [Polypterus senegalus]
MPGTLPDPTMPGSSAVLMPIERQMAMGSNMMGLQGPNLNNSCASPQVPSMHSEAKLRLKAALTHHSAGMSNGNMNSMGHMMEMMSTRPEQTHHQMHSHPHQHQSLPPQHHAYQHPHPQHHHHAHPQAPHHHQQSHPHHHSHNPHLHGHPGHHQTSPHQAIHSGPQSQVSPAAQQMQPTQTLQPPQPTGGRRRRVVDEDPDERRRKFLERNRAAATRCRQKRKVWVMSLEKKAEELTQTNMQLQNEVTMLKNEVTQLKQLLLTHKDCPITAMQKESQGYLTCCRTYYETLRRKYSLSVDGRPVWVVRTPPHRNPQLSELCQQLQSRLEADMRYALTHRQRVRADGIRPEEDSFLEL